MAKGVKDKGKAVLDVTIYKNALAGCVDVDLTLADDMSVGAACSTLAYVMPAFLGTVFDTMPAASTREKAQATADLLVMFQGQVMEHLIKGPVPGIAGSEQVEFAKELVADMSASIQSTPPLES